MRGREQRELAGDHPLKAIYNRRLNTILQSQRRGRLDEATADAMRKLAKDKLQRALSGADYARVAYVRDDAGGAARRGRAEMLTLREAERAFQLDPPPKSESESFAAFLHFYESSLNERVRRFLGKRAFDAETLLEYKLACATAMLERWERFDPNIGSRFETFVHHDVQNALLRARILEEAGSFSSLDEYKAVRQMGALMYGSTQGDSLREFIKKRGCSEATAKRFLKTAQLTLNVSSLENDTEASYTWDYVSVLQGGVLAEKVREAFAKLSERVSFDELAIKFEASSPRTAERAYNRAVEKLTLGLVELGALHAVRIERTPQDIYRYQADNEGDRGEFALDPAGELKIIALAELDTVKTHRFAEQAASYLRTHAGEKLAKKLLLAFE